MDRLIRLAMALSRLWKGMVRCREERLLPMEDNISDYAVTVTRCSV